MYPIATADEMLGILEMSSPHPNTLQEPVLNAIERVLPLIQELLQYQLRQFDERLEQAVKINFISLQPAVEWKFYETAWADVRAGRIEGDYRATTLVRFPQVYPFYGAVDVRNSSLERQQAIRQDLTDQFNAVDELLTDLLLPADLRHPEPLTAQYEQWRTKLAEGLQPDDEPDIGLFLSRELTPYLRQLVPVQNSSQALLQRYFARIDSETGQFQQTLKRYDRSMDWLNAVINDYIVQEENQLQAIYPHDRYRTDGMDYTLYVGQSMAPDILFAPDIRRQLADWQLSSMAAIAQLTHRLLPRLPLPLQTTQLILARSQPVDISFRPDERRFDVEGSYSIRYEVLKKRIDKAFVRGTRERLTQPDTIALVYTQTTELNNYLPTIASLQQRGQLRADIDYLTLALMQGVDNLKVLRLTINYTE